MDLKSEIMRRVESCPRGENGGALLSCLTGVLDDTSAAEMANAIELACEGIDLREW
jgi:hypothetical protein